MDIDNTKDGAPLYRAAKTICEMGKWKVSNLSLQKLLYLSHMLSVGGEQKSLIGRLRLFQAWDFGPVQPDLYHKFKAFGSDHIPNVFPTSLKAYGPEDPQYRFIAEVMRQVGDHKPGKLVALTHQEDGAWAKNYGQGIRHVTISDSDIASEFRLRVGS